MSLPPPRGSENGDCDSTVIRTPQNIHPYGGLSTHTGPQVVDETFQKQLEAVKAGGVKFYWLGAGTTDMARERTVTLSELVKKDGFTTMYREIPGRHYWFLWRDFLVHYAQIAFVPPAKS